MSFSDDDSNYDSDDDDKGKEFIFHHFLENKVIHGNFHIMINFPSHSQSPNQFNLPDDPFTFDKKCFLT